MNADAAAPPPPQVPATGDSVFFKLVRVVNLTARPFQQRVGRQDQLTLNEWRTMAVLGAQPGLTATQVADLTGLDKMAVSRALTDDGRPPLEASGLKLHDRLSAIAESLARVQKRGPCSRTL